MPSDNFIAEEDEDIVRMIEKYKQAGKVQPDFFPLPTYDLVQCGYPLPDHGEMVCRRFGGTDDYGRLMSPNGMWCKVEDVKKFLAEQTKNG